MPIISSSKKGYVLAKTWRKALYVQNAPIFAAPNPSPKFVPIPASYLRQILPMRKVGIVERRPRALRNLLAMLAEIIQRFGALAQLLVDH